MIFSPLMLTALFVASTIIGYLLIKNVPVLLHTPLMSGMNALSGVTVIGALAMAALRDYPVMAYVAITLAMINVVGGFQVTGRMLRMFRHGEKEERDDV